MVTLSVLIVISLPGVVVLGRLSFSDGLKSLRTTARLLPLYPSYAPFHQLPTILSIFYTSGKQVFQAMGSYDLGCTAGSGENTLSVFADAGLSLRAGELQSQLRKGESLRV